jgi:hypothetical protein
MCSAGDGPGSADATAFAHRASRILAIVVAFYDGPDDRPARDAWVTDFAADLLQGDTGTYVNFVGDEGEARTRAAYPGATWDRLATVKSRYDPTNLFRLTEHPAHLTGRSQTWTSSAVRTLDATSLQNSTAARS